MAVLSHRTSRRHADDIHCRRSERRLAVVRSVRRAALYAKNRPASRQSGSSSGGRRVHLMRPPGAVAWAKPSALPAGCRDSAGIHAGYPHPPARIIAQIRPPGGVARELQAHAESVSSTQRRSARAPASCRSAPARLNRPCEYGWSRKLDREQAGHEHRHESSRRSAACAQSPARLGRRREEGEDEQIRAIAVTNRSTQSGAGITWLPGFWHGRAGPAPRSARQVEPLGIAEPVLLRRWRARLHRS